MAVFKTTQNQRELILFLLSPQHKIHKDKIQNHFSYIPWEARKNQGTPINHPKFMAFLLPNLSPSLLINSKSFKDREKPVLYQTQTLPSHYQTTTTTTSTTTKKPTNTNSSMPPPLQVKTPPGAQDKEQHQRDEFYVNLGLAVRTLREDLPVLFTEDLNYDIYR